MEEKKALEPGKTVLGSIPASYDGKIAKMTVRFGNYIFPPIKKGEKEEFVHLKVAEYRKLLEQFLNSPAGQQYKRPSEEEIEQASILVLNKENEYLKAHGFDAPKKEEKKPAEESKEKPKPIEKQNSKPKPKEKKAPDQNIDDFATVLLEDTPVPAKKKSPNLIDLKTGAITSIKKNVFKIGCSSGCDLVIDQDAKSHIISRQHATIITKNDDSLYITDKSSNGTFICKKKDGEYIRLPKDHEVELKHGTYIKFATEVFLYKEV